VARRFLGGEHVETEVEDRRIVVGGLFALGTSFGIDGNMVTVEFQDDIIQNEVAYVLSHDRHNLNTRAALLHVFGDLLGSLAAITSGLTIYYFGWMLIDPLASVLICLLIVFSSVRLLREALHIIMEGVPGHLDLKQVGQAMAAADERIQSVHDLHIWTLASGYIALSAHMVLPNLDHWQDILANEQKFLSEEFGIEHITLQPEISRSETVVPIDQLFG